MTTKERARARELIRRYCERSEANASDIHYAQFRPMNHLGDSPDSEMTCDCSGHVTGAFKWADDWTPAFKVEDPNGPSFNYNGYGYTGTLLAHNRTRRVSSPYRVGDLAIYGSSWSNTKHVVTCRKFGDAASSVWTSHGSEAGPYPVRLHYRGDLLAVVRPLGGR